MEEEAGAADGTLLHFNSIGFVWESPFWPLACYMCHAEHMLCNTSCCSLSVKGGLI